MTPHGLGGKPGDRFASVGRSRGGVTVRAGKARLRLPELCGLIWLALLAGAIWMHTHATKQGPIYDAFTYYQKAHNFWAAIQGGMWFNPLDVEPTFRPPGTILMSYPFGFDPDPRSFYFRSIYLPALLLFTSVLIAAYEVGDVVRTRWHTILTAIFFSTMTLSYHFEFGDLVGGGYWGLVDAFLAGLAALAAACVWRGTCSASRTWAWAVAASLASATSILVKPTGTLVAAIAGLAWTVFALGTLRERHGSSERQPGLTLRLLMGAAMIGLTCAATVTASLLSRYLSHENMASGEAAIAIMKAELRLPLSILWPVVNTGLGGAFVLWTGIASTICMWGVLSSGRSVMMARHVIGALTGLATLLFGIWFWLVGSGGAVNIRYGVPFFMMGMIWLIPATMWAWRLAPLLLRLSASGIMIVAALNLVLVLLVPRPSLAWQKLSGIGVTASFPPPVLAAFRRLIATSSSRPLDIYSMSRVGSDLITYDAILSSIVNQTLLLHPGHQPLSMHRPFDWNRPSTFRIAEIAAANTLLINPQEARQAPAGAAVGSLAEEEGVFTAWANRLSAEDGISVFFSAPTVKILTVVDPAKFKVSLDRLVARYVWNPTFERANHLPQH